MIKKLLPSNSANGRTQTTTALFIRMLLLTLVFVSSAACEPEADISNPEKYSRDGISFSFPGNWSVTEDVSEGDFRYIFVESPGDALTIIQIFPDDALLPLAVYAENFSNGARENTSVGEVNKGQFVDFHYTKGERSLAGIRERFSIFLLGEEVPHIREYFFISLNGLNTYFITQISEEDLNRVKPGFDLILDSL